MGREVTAASGEATWYVPDIDDNRTDPNPFQVLIEPMSGAELQRFNKGMGKLTRGNRQPNFVAGAQETRKAIIENRVAQVKGYRVRDPKTQEILEPVNGKELYRAVLRVGGSELDVLDDIKEALEDHSKLEEGLPENCGSRSDSFAPRTVSPKGGAANGAAERSEAVRIGTNPDVEVSEIVTG